MNALVTSRLAASVIFVSALLSRIQTSEGVGCFVCTSIDGSDPQCDDTFNNTGGYYHRDCESGREDREGTFPATQCIKMKAELDDGSITVTRTCVVDNGGTNSETEIGRMSHCGIVNWMIYNGTRVKGCVLTCDTDGCNTASFNTLHSTKTAILLASLTSLYLLRYS